MSWGPQSLKKGAESTLVTRLDEDGGGRPPFLGTLDLTKGSG